MTHTTLPYATALLPPRIFAPPGEKQKGRDWSSVWKPLSLFLADGGRGCCKNLSRTKLCLHPPGCSSLALARLSHTRGKDCSFSKLQLCTATPRSPLSCNPSQDVTGTGNHSNPHKQLGWKNPGESLPLPLPPQVSWRCHKSTVL